MALVGINELLLIGAGILALLILPKALPKLAASIGETRKEFRRSMKEADQVTEESSTD